MTDKPNRTPDGYPNLSDPGTGIFFNPTEVQALRNRIGELEAEVISLKADRDAERELHHQAANGQEPMQARIRELEAALADTKLARGTSAESPCDMTSDGNAAPQECSCRDRIEPGD